MNGARNPFFNSSRDFKRYDPQTRKYRDWYTPHDWSGAGVAGFGVGPFGIGFPRFTKSDGKKMLRRYARDKPLKPSRMGKEWHHDGPKVGGVHGNDLLLMLLVAIPTRSRLVLARSTQDSRQRNARTSHSGSSRPILPYASRDARRSP